MPLKKIPIDATKNVTISGTDTNGESFESLEEMWSTEITTEESRETWYKQGVDYWTKTEATVDGVLGGFGSISDIDIRGSREFIKALPKINYKGNVADCGAGIGRTTKQLLCPLFKSVDLIDPTPPYIVAAKENLKDTATMGRFFQLGLEDFHPEKGYYSLVFCQWVLPYLVDDDLVAFLQRCVEGLEPGGIIIVKENISRDGFILDREDTSITRSDLQYRQIFHRAGLKLVAEKLQSGFPKQLFPVRMYALRPKVKVQVEEEPVVEDTDMGDN
jgi:protein N-terminal methyltransferase